MPDKHRKKLDSFVAKVIPNSWYKTDDEWRHFSHGMYFGIVLSFIVTVLIWGFL